MSKLILPTLRTFLLGSIALGIVLFLPAWTFNYWQAWVFIVVFMTSVNAIGLYLSINDPELLERRKNIGPKAEQNMVQKIIISFSILGVIAIFVLSALDHRFGWSPVPLALGSLWGLVVLFLILPLLIWRILNEEQLLKSELPGYKEYAQKVRYRLAPYVW